MFKRLVALVLIALLVMVGCATNELNVQTPRNAQSITQTDDIELPSSNVESVKEPFLDLTDFVMIEGFKTIERIYLNETNNILLTVQRMSSKKSAISMFDYSELKTVNYKVFDSYIAKLKPLDNEFLVFDESDKSVTKMTYGFEEEYSFALPDDLHSSVHSADVSDDELSLIYISNDAKNLMLDTVPPSHPVSIKYAKRGIMSAAFVNNELIYYSVRTTEYPFEFGLCGKTGTDKLFLRSYAFVPKPFDNGVLMLESMEMRKDNRVYLYDLCSLDTPPRVLEVNGSSDVTISRNGRFALSASTDGENLTAMIYNLENGKIDERSVHFNTDKYTVNLMGDPDCYYISDDGTNGFILFLGEGFRLYKLSLKLH